MKKFFYLLIAVFVFVTLISCNIEASNLEKNYNTPTAIGRIILPEGTGLSYSDIYVKVMETSAQYQVGSDGTWVVSGLDADTEYTLYFQDSPFYDISRSLEKENDNGNHYGAKKDNVKGSTGSGFDNGIVQIKKTATIMGFVEFSDESSLLGVDVYIPGTSFIAKTDESGKFSLTGVPDGRYRIVADKDNYIPAYSDYITILTDDESDNLINLENSLVLKPGYGTIEGSLVYEGNMSSTVPYATVSIANNNDASKNVTVTSNESGKYSAGSLSPGVYSITIVPDSLYQSATVSNVEVFAAQTTIVDPVVIKALGGVFKGSVNTFDGKSALGASVLLASNSGTQRYTTQADSDGIFIINNVLPGQYTCTIIMDGYSPSSADVAIASAQTSELSCTLQLGVGTISGKVYLEGSEVYSGITVTAINTADSSIKYSSTTLADGSFDILQIDIEGNYQLVVSKEGYVTDSYTMTSVKLGGISKIEDIVLKSVQATVSGNIILEGAASHEGVMLLLQNNEHSYQGTTDMQGAFSISGVVPGTYTLLASKGGYSSKETVSFTVVPSENKVLDNIILPIGIRSITGSVVLELATDHSGALVTATNLNESSLIYSAITNSNGDFSFAGMKPGEYMISISKTGYRSVTLETVNVVESNSITLDSVDVKIAKGYISGIAKLEGWTDYSGIKVELLGTDYAAETDSDGTYTFEVPSGNYPGGLRFSKEDFELTSHAKTITVLTDSTYGVEEYILTCQKASITGRVDVLGTDDESGVKVSLVGTEYSAVTGSDGTFTFDHVILGKYTLRLERENANIVNKAIELDPCPSLDVGICEVIPNSSSLTGYARLDGLTDHKGIKVTVRPQDSSLATLETETDSNGYFYIGNVISTGTYDVIFSKEGWDSRSVNVSNLTPLEERDITSDEEIVMKDSISPILNSVKINNGANTASDKNVIITLDAFDDGSGLAKMQICFDGVFDRTVTMLDFKPVSSVTLPVGNGEKTVYVKVYDVFGNESAVVHSSVILVDQKTEIGGRILKDTTLTSTDSPYLVIGNIIIESGVTLTIEEGVDLQFAGEYYISSFGNIHALGTEEHPVVFESVSDTVKWRGISSSSSCVLGGETFAPTFEYGCYLRNVIIRGNADGICGDVFIEDSLVDSDYALGSGSRKFSGTVVDSSLSGNIMLSGSFRLIGNTITAPFFSIDSNDISAQDSAVIFKNEIAGELWKIFLFNGNYHDIAVVNNYFHDFSLDSYSSLLHSGTIISENNTFENMDAVLFNSKERRIGANNYVDCTLNIIIEEQDNDQDVLKYGDNFSNIIDCGPLDVGTSITSRKTVDYQYNFWGYDKTEILDNSGTMTPSFIIDQTVDMEKSIIEYDNWVHDAYPYAGYRGEDYVGFEMELQENNKPLFRINESYEREATGEAINLNISSLTEERISDYRVSFDAESFTKSSDDGWMAIPSDGNISIVPSSEDAENGVGEYLFIQVRDDQGRLSAVRIVPANTNIAGPAGGIICYDKGNDVGGWRYIEVTPSNIRYDVTNDRYTCNSSDSGYYSFQRYFEYGSANKISDGIYNIPVFSNGLTKYDKETCTVLDVGAGKQNTEILMMGMNDSSVSCNYPAARACYELEYNGYDDWYLPSRNEAYLFADVIQIDVYDSIYEIMCSSESSANPEKCHRVELHYGLDGEFESSVSSSVNRGETHDVWGIRYF